MYIHPKPIATLMNWPACAEHIVEYAGRTCTGTAGRTVGDGAFVKRMIDKGHESVIEHASLTFWLFTDRAVSHELVRHRLASFSQKSQRYVRDDQLHVIRPLGISAADYTAEWCWRHALSEAERRYFELIDIHGYRSETARSVLPNCTATELIMTANMREWRHILKLRCQKRAHPDCRRLMMHVLSICLAQFPSFFGDLESLYDQKMLV